MRKTPNDATFCCRYVDVKSGYFFFFPAMSENYVVFIEQPIKMDLMKIMTSRMKGKGIDDCIYWDPKQDTVFHVVNKHTGQVPP